ncbi:uncharacterized protein LACBIDRAFT_335345 [Laccaria bicolor S238N-H82]|uniref:Predicted protein n=1 Tax=Laccaria bicolor (strain S238N-H82 / ATCC MYA-4686) TaxID=486041 RepID=B0E225_LACBS|nr:uncharacterized protein LACBIDRAFT_335345 [Laccaria bicolor S238N-H82]EDQ99120.1 predicted protein [Laccaria bicolor S238N-H82]|eukprot:XP_001890253.1 predicted protein [Laccaria bicolor S238N-H82]
MPYQDGYPNGLETAETVQNVKLFDGEASRDQRTTDIRQDRTVDSQSKYFKDTNPVKNARRISKRKWQEKLLQKPRPKQCWAICLCLKITCQASDLKASNYILSLGLAGRTSTHINIFHPLSDSIMSNLMSESHCVVDRVECAAHALMQWCHGRLDLGQKGQAEMLRNQCISGVE